MIRQDTGTRHYLVTARGIPVSGPGPFWGVPQFLVPGPFGGGGYPSLWSGSVRGVPQSGLGYTSWPGLGYTPPPQPGLEYPPIPGQDRWRRGWYASSGFPQEDFLVWQCCYSCENVGWQKHTKVSCLRYLNKSSLCGWHSFYLLKRIFLLSSCEMGIYN